MKKYNVIEFRDTGGIDNIKKGLPDDLLIVCASFEDRSRTALESLSKKYSCNLAIIYVNEGLIYDQENKKTIKNLAIIKQITKKHAKKTNIVEGNQNNSKEQFCRIRESLLSLSDEIDANNITIDVSTFNREALITIISLLRTYWPSSRIRLLYTSPKNYGPWLSRGYDSVRSVIGFGGIFEANKPILLIILSGFEPERTIKIIEEHEPYFVLLGVADPPSDKKYLPRNLIEQKLILSRNDVIKFTFPCNDLIECKKVLEARIKPYKKNFNIVIAPMSTKISTISAMLVAMENANIQITYSLPNIYNTKNYSRGFNNIYINFVPRIQKEKS